MLSGLFVVVVSSVATAPAKQNVLFIVSDDLVSMHIFTSFWYHLLHWLPYTNSFLFRTGESAAWGNLLIFWLTRLLVNDVTVPNLWLRMYTAMVLLLQTMDDDEYNTRIDWHWILLMMANVFNVVDIDYIMYIM